MSICAVDEISGPDRSSFSTDINHYLPLCVPCHKRFDKES